MKKPKQKGFEFEPEYAVSSTGTKHEFKGGIFVPTPDEITRIEQEQKEKAVGDATVVGLRIKKERQFINMNGIEALWLRTGRRPQ